MPPNGRSLKLITQVVVIDRVFLVAFCTFFVVIVYLHLKHIVADGGDEERSAEVLTRPEHHDVEELVEAAEISEGIEHLQRESLVDSLLL